MCEVDTLHFHILSGVRVFHRARSAAPAIIFMDEIEAIVGARDMTGGGGKGNSEVQNRILATLLTEMDGVGSTNGVLLVGATNRPDLIDPALLRFVTIGKPTFCLTNKTAVLTQTNTPRLNFVCTGLDDLIVYLRLACLGTPLVLKFLWFILRTYPPPLTSAVQLAQLT